MTQLTKVVNGIEIPLTQEEVAEVEAREALWLANSKQRDLDAVLRKREKEYGTTGEQLDMLFHQGLDAWREHVQRVKDANPKPTI